jgi:hypothetical protein
VPRKYLRNVADILKGIHAFEGRQAAHDKAQAVFEKLTSVRLKEATAKVEKPWPRR